MDSQSKLQLATLREAHIARDCAFAELERARDELNRCINAMVSAEEQCDIATRAYAAADQAHMAAQSLLKRLSAETGLSLSDMGEFEGSISSAA